MEAEKGVLKDEHPQNDVLHTYGMLPPVLLFQSSKKSGGLNQFSASGVKPSKTSEPKSMRNALRTVWLDPAISKPNTWLTVEGEQQTNR